MKKYLPEGKIFNSPENGYYLRSPEAMMEAQRNGIILEGHAVMCTTDHDLVVELPFGRGIIPRIEGAVGIAEGTTRDIALLSWEYHGGAFKKTGAGRMHKRVHKPTALRRCDTGKGNAS